MYRVTNCDSKKSLFSATEIGTVLTTITANDVDTNPALTYHFARDTDRAALHYFSIDRFSGKVVLKKPLDFEEVQEFKLRLTASDAQHTAQTTLTIRVTDVNDNSPQFAQPCYQAALPAGQSAHYADVLAVNASDSDFDDNARIKYSLLNPTPGFSIGMYDGVLRANLSNISSISTQSFQLTVVATDEGSPPLSSVAAVLLTGNGNGSGSRHSSKEYRVQVSEDTPKGATILKLPSPSGSAPFYILDGNDDSAFEVTSSLSSSGYALVLVDRLDRERRDAYSLKLSSAKAKFTNTTSFLVAIAVEDANDNAPVFQESDYEITITEGMPVGASVARIAATDADLAGTQNAEVRYDLTSGNDGYLFKIDAKSGVLHVNNSLDYDSGATQHRLIIRACDQGVPPLCTLQPFQVLLEDENDNAPHFPVSEYLEFVAENEPVGTVVFIAHATDLDRGEYGNLNYSLSSVSASGYHAADESWKLFHVDAATGLVATGAVFDYEQKSRYVFMLRATDAGGKSSSVKVRVEIESRDEFHPQFTERTYRFVLAAPPQGNLPAGYVVGHVTATDRDKGSDGRVVYQLPSQHACFKLNRTTGAVLAKRQLTGAELLRAGKDISLVVTASSGRQGSLTNMTVVEIVLDPLADLTPSRENGATVAATDNGIADWALGLLISLVLLVLAFGAAFVFVHMRNKRNCKLNKPSLSGGDAVAATNNYVDPSAFDTIPIRGAGNMPNAGSNQFAPPKYDEIPPYGPSHPASSNSGAATTSELSGSEQSGSSGRGSAEDGEDGEDEEIRMINEGPLQRESDDNLSDVSVRNTQEYLARLGIVNNGVPQAAGSSKDGLHHLHMFDEEVNAENDISNFYAKLNDVANSDRGSSTDDGTGGVNPTALDHVMAIGGYGDVPAVTHQPSMNGSLSSIVHSEEELAGSYNWDYLLDWGPQYQPLAHVFSEIARLKDDTASVQSATSGNSSVKSKGSTVASKTIPPPLITSVAPRSIAMPVLNARGGSSHHSSGGHGQMIMLPRSPISHDASGATFSTSAAMSPSFSPSLSPLATKSPSISPLVTPGLAAAHHMMAARQPQQSRNKSVVDAELRL